MQSKYEDLQQVGSGGHGDIFIGKQLPSRKKVVLKRLPRTEAPHRIQTEIDACERLKDVKGVPKLLHHFEDETHFWMVFDLVPGTDLYFHLYNGGTMTEKMVKRIMKQLVRILCQIHSKGVVHKDIKLENLMYQSQTTTVSVIDFGLSFLFEGENDMCEDFVGTREYSAPELLLCSDRYLARAADVWSLGVTMFTLCFNLFPFSYDNEMRRYVLETRCYPPPDFPTDHQIGPDAVDLIKRMLESDPVKRITLAEMSQHPFLKPKPKLWRRMRFTL